LARPANIDHPTIRGDAYLYVGQSPPPMKPGHHN
jgi:hypothetical protein